VGFVATRVSFDPVAGTLAFHENTNPASVPDVSVVLMPNGVFGRAVGSGEPVIGANLAIAPLLFHGLNAATGRYEFGDSTFTLSGTAGVFAQGELTDIGIDPNTFAFTAQVHFDLLSGALDSPFVQAWEANLDLLTLQTPSGVLDLLALTQNFTVVGMSDTDFIVLATSVPEPSSLILLAIGGLALGGLAVARRRARFAESRS
jgi:hypothetical protein